MSEEKLQNLIDAYPDYSSILRTILQWFITHPNQRHVSKDLFYTERFSFSREEIDVAFTLLKESLILKRTFQILDDTGTKVGKDYDNFEDIPPYLDTMWGEKRNTSDLFVVPCYFRIA